MPRRLLQALLTPASILVVAIPLFPNTIGVLEQHAHSVSTGEHLFSVERKPALGFAFVPVVIRMLVVLGFLALASTLVNFKTICRQTAAPIQGITETLRGMFERLRYDGSGDLRERLHAATYDKLRLLADRLNDFLDALASALKQARETARGSNEATERIVSGVNTSREELTSLSGVSVSNGVVGEQASAMEESAASVRQMGGSLRNIADAVHTRLEKTTELAKFAVVAEEIRRLAEGVAENARHVSSTLSDMADGIQSSMKTMEESAEAFDRQLDRFLVE